MELEQINSDVEIIIDNIIRDLDKSTLDFTISDKLRVILSDSAYALSLITTIEEEFDIEFDDDEINLSFFQDPVIIVKSIQGHLRNPL